MTVTEIRDVQVTLTVTEIRDVQVTLTVTEIRDVQVTVTDQRCPSDSDRSEMSRWQ